MGYEVKDKIAIVTGSARGFGKEFAIRLLNHGAKVCISDVDETGGGETSKDLGERYGCQNVTFFRYIYLFNTIILRYICYSR